MLRLHYAAVEQLCAIILVCALLMTGCLGAQPRALTSTPATEAAVSAPTEQPVQATETPSLAPKPTASKVIEASAAPKAQATATSQPARPAATRATFPTPFVILDLPPAEPIAPAAEALSPASARRLRIVAELGEGRIGGIAWSPGGRYLAVAAGGRVLLYDAASFDLKTTLTSGPSAGLLAFNPTGDRLAIVRAGGIVPKSTSAPGEGDGLPRSGDTIQVWDWTAGRKIAEMGLTPADRPTARFEIEQLAYGAGEVVAANLRDGLDPNQASRAAAAWQAEDGKLIFASFYENQNSHATLDFSPDGQRLLIPAGFGFQIREVRSGQLLSEQFDSGADRVTYAPDGQSFYYLSPGESAAGSGQAYDLSQAALPNSGEPLFASQRFAAQHFAGTQNAPVLGLIRSWGTLAAIANDCESTHRLDVWIIHHADPMHADQPLERRVEQKTLAGLQQGCGSIAIRADGRQLAYADNGSVVVWDLERLAQIAKLRLAAFEPAAIGMRPLNDNGVQYLAVTTGRSQGEAVQVWDLLHNKQLAAFPEGDDVALHPGGEVVAWTSGAGDLKFWDWTRNQVLAALPREQVRGIPVIEGSGLDLRLYLKFSPDGTRLNRPGTDLVWTGPAGSPGGQWHILRGPALDHLG